jgi:hypothetical protein
MRVSIMPHSDPSVRVWLGALRLSPRRGFWPILKPTLFANRELGEGCGAVP